MSDEGEIGTAMIGGKATFYDDGPGLYGAAGPLLREMLGGDPTFRGESVTVCADDCVTVVLVDWCACGERGGEPTLVDLSPEAFARLAPLSQGVVDVTIQSAIALPATDTFTRQQLGQVESLSVITLALVGFSAFSLLLRRMRG
jgi:hypothetical protein